MRQDTSPSSLYGAKSKPKARKGARSADEGYLKSPSSKSISEIGQLTEGLGKLFRGGEGGESAVLEREVTQALDDISRISQSHTVVSKLSQAEGQLSHAFPSRAQDRARNPNGTKKAPSQVQELKSMLELSKGIMKKLHRKNVFLEQQNRLLQADATQQAKSRDAGTAEVRGNVSSVAGEHGDIGSVESVALGEGLTCSCGAASATIKKYEADRALLAEKERTIEELFKANRVLQSRCMELEAAMNEVQTSMNSSISATRGAMEESKIYLEKYRGLRRDFHQLLSKRVTAADRGGVREMNKEAHDLIKDLRKCLDHEIKDKALEAEMNNQKLYYTEKVATDWYVERRLLETQLNKLTNQMRERDALDNRIESVICSLANRVKELEEEKNVDI